MDTVSAEHFLLDQIPMVRRPAIPTTLRTAYAAADVMIAGEPILQIESARDNRGRIVQWAVDFAFKRLIDTGEWPFAYRWRSFAKPTGRYLEIRFSHSVMSISQVADARKQPRDVVFRGNARLNNEPFFDLPEFADERSVRGLPHFLLVHGYQELAFAHLGVPPAHHQRGYIYRTPNLMLMPHEIVVGPGDHRPPIEDTDIDATMTLKDEIEKWRRDHDE
jgi:hypothetical protein